MTPWLIVVTGLIYAYIFVENLFKGDYGLAFMYAGYAFANYGAYLLATR